MSTEQGRSLYGESKMVGRFSELADRVLGEKMLDYTALQETAATPRARAEMARIVTHAAFELAWRHGELDTMPLSVVEAAAGTPRQAQMDM